MNKLKVKKEDLKPLIGFLGIGIILILGFYYITTNEYQYSEAKLMIDRLEFSCEIEQGVPTNHYTGQIKMTNKIPVLSFMFYNSLTEDQITELTNELKSKVEQLPCYEKLPEVIP